MDLVFCVQKLSEEGEIFTQNYAPLLGIGETTRPFHDLLMVTTKMVYLWVLNDLFWKISRCLSSRSTWWCLNSNILCSCPPLLGSLVLLLLFFLHKLLGFMVIAAIAVIKKESMWLIYYYLCLYNCFGNDIGKYLTTNHCCVQITSGLFTESSE